MKSGRLAFIPYLLAIILAPVAAAQLIPPRQPLVPQSFPEIETERLDNGLGLFVWPHDASLTPGVSIWITAAARHAPPELPALVDILCHRLADQLQGEGHAEADGLLLTVPADDLPAVAAAFERLRAILSLEPADLAGEPTEKEAKPHDTDEAPGQRPAPGAALQARVPPAAWEAVIGYLLPGSDYGGALANDRAAADDAWSTQLAAEFIETQLVPGNVRVLVRGRFEPDEVLAAARRTLGTLARRSPPADAPDPVRDRETLPLRTIETNVVPKRPGAGSNRWNALVAWELLPIGFFENAGSDALAHWLTNPVDGALRDHAVAIERLAFTDVGLLVLWLRAREADIKPDALLEAVDAALRRAADEQFDPLPLERSRQLALRDAYAPTHAGLRRDVRAARRVLLSGDPQAATRWISRLERNDARRLARAAKDLQRARRAAVAWQAPLDPIPRGRRSPSTAEIELAARRQLAAVEQRRDGSHAEPLELSNGRTLTLHVRDDPTATAAQVWLLRTDAPPTRALPEALAEAGVSVPDLADVLSYNACGVVTLLPNADDKLSGWYGWGPPDVSELLLSELFLRAIPGIAAGDDATELRLVVSGALPAATFHAALAEVLAAARSNAAAE